MEWLDGISQKLLLNYNSGPIGAVIEWSSGCLISHCLERDLPVYSEEAEGKSTVTSKELIAAATKFGSMAAFNEKPANGRYSAVLFSKDGILTLNNAFEGESVTAHLLTRSMDEVAYFNEHIAAKLVEISDRDVHVITKGPKGPRLESIGIAHMDLERENYEKNVLDAYDFILKDLKNKKNPTGRLVIIDGPAGTGKTHLIRGIMHDAHSCIFVFVHPENISDLSGPNLVPLLNETKGYNEDDNTKSIVIVVEDADDVLIPRGRDNMHSISALLNYTAGIFGSLFDLRVIATTNAKKIEMEKALLRAGRLSKQVMVGNLSPAKATQVYRRISGDQNFSYAEPKALADVYAEANGIANPAEPDEEGMGFSR